MKYANYDLKTRKILGWYDKDIHASIPIPNIEISDEAWQNVIDNGHNKVNSDGTTEVFDFRTSEEVEQAELDRTKAEAQTYLASTDWYIIRFADSGIEVPQEVKDMRAEARLVL